MRFLSLIVFSFLLFGVVCSAFDKSVFPSIVKVYVVKSSPNYHQPWQNYPQKNGSGSGCVISGNRILTSAHIVSNATFIMARRQGDSKKYVAKVKVACDECDLAILEVEDEAFFANCPAIELGNLPQLQDTVTVLGYPMGGDNISITEGVVSRIEPTRYSHSGRYLLAAQIDAAINPGNSGGPVIQNGKLVGVAFQGVSAGENMGYMVPPPVIRHFYKDIEDGVVDGFPDINIHFSKMENPDLRDWTDMRKNQTGVLVSYIPYLEKQIGTFKLDDVILNVDGVSVANDGTVPFRDGEVVFFGNLIWLKQVGETCEFSLLRDKKQITVTRKLEREKQLVPERCFDKLPQYFILGGLVFVPLNQNYLDAWGTGWEKRAPRDLVNAAASGEITKKIDQVVVLSAVLADDINVGYQDIRYEIVKKFQGEDVRNLRDFIDKINKQKTGFVELTLGNHQKVVFDIQAFRGASERILKRYRIEAAQKLDKN